MLAAQRRLLGDAHPHTLTSLYGLASVHESRGKYEQAEREFAEVLERRTQDPGPDHPLTLVAAQALGLLYLTRGKPG